MGVVSTTTNGAPLQYPASTKVDYNPVDGRLYVVVWGSTANTVEVHRSADAAGSSWAIYASFVRADLQEIGPIFIDPEGWLGFVFRVHESGLDRIFYRRMDAAGVFSTEILIDNFFTTPAGTVFNGMDLVTINIQAPQKMQKTIIAVGTNAAGNLAVSLYGVLAFAGSNPVSNNGILAGNRQLAANTGTGHVGPSLDLEHVGNGKGSPVPNLWLTFGRTKIYMAKLAWNGGGWIVPTSATAISGTITAMNAIPGRWDGVRYLMAHPEGSTVRIYERNKSNTSTTTRVTTAHTAGAVRQCAVSYNAINQDLRVYAVGTSNNDLYYIDYIRLTATWTAWATVTTTDILGANVDNWSIRRGSTFSNKHDVITAHSGASNIVHTQLSLSYPPSAPSWSFAAVPYQNGSAADANAALLLDWNFNDPDPLDVQKDYALSRQIGNDTIEYWQASNGTWQASEVKNATAATEVTLPTGLFVDRFNTGVSGWTPTSCTFAATSVRYRSASVSALLTVSGSPAQAFARTANIAVSATTSYSAELWGLSVAGYSDFGVAIDWYTSGSVYISTSTSGGSALTANVWGRRSVTATSPGTAAFAQIGPTIGSTPTGQVVYVDDVSFGPTPTPWASATDTPHTYRVKVWDAADVASSYSTGLVLVPSVKVNPTITQPADSSTWTTASVTVTWTVAEQTAWRVETLIFGFLLQDSGKVVSSATSYVSPEVLANGFNYSIRLTTWNNEGLASDAIVSNFAVAFVPPRTPTHVSTAVPASGWINIAITNPGVSTFVNVGAAAQGNNITLTPAQAAGVTTGDLLVGVSAIENSGTGVPNLPTDYTNLVLFGNVRLFGKIHDGSEAAPSCSYTGGAAGAATTAQMAAFRQAYLATLGTAMTKLNGSAANIAYDALTVPTPNCIVIYIGWKQDGTGTSIATPAGFTELGDIVNSNGQMLVWGYQIQTAATNIGASSLTVTGGVSAISRSIFVAISGVPAVTHNDVYRLETGAPLTDGVRVGHLVAVNGSVNDFRAKARTDWSYRVLAYGDNGSTGVGLWSPS